MAKVHNDEFKREAVRIALTSGQARRQVASDLDVGFSTLAKWIQKSRPGDLPPAVDIDLAKENERLRKENRLLTEESGYVDCQVARLSSLRTSRGFRAWRIRPVSQRQRYDMVLLAHIREQHHLSLGSYGRPRMTQELKEIGLMVGHRRVGRLMRNNGIRIVRTCK